MTQQPTVRTSFGPVRGIRERGLSVFRGVRYGADTGGANRFLAPRPPAPWSDALDCAHDAPMALQRSFFDPLYSQVLGGAYDPRMEAIGTDVVGSEDCLFLNVWTSSLDGGAKLPVILWVHPGALRGWSAVSPWTDGAALARQENVVVVSFNHRLGPFGFTYLGDRGDPAYEAGANAGLLDIVAALKWLQENIASFGGDPANVTLMGQSGGAGKVGALLACPPAAGLFHKAILMGGTGTRVHSRARAARGTATLLDRLRIPPQAFRDLHTVAAEKLLQAIGEDYPSMVVSGPALARHPFSPDSPAESAHVPILIGTTTDEMTYLTLGADFPDELDEESARRRLIAVGWGFNEATADLALDTARRLEPTSSWRRRFVLAATAAYRDDHLIMVERKLARNAAPAFMYLFDWKSPAFEGRYGAMHVFDVPFAFSNLHAAGQIFGPEPDPRRHHLATNMSRAWAAFARTGQPRHSGLPDWPAYSLERRETMILDYSCRLAQDPLSSVRTAFAGMRATRLAGREEVNG